MFDAKKKEKKHPFGKAWTSFFSWNWGFDQDGWTDE